MEGPVRRARRRGRPPLGPRVINVHVRGRLPLLVLDVVDPVGTLSLRGFDPVGTRIARLLVDVLKKKCLLGRESET